MCPRFLKMLVTEPSYRCKVHAGNKSAVLRIGWQSYPIEVDEVSRDMFSVVVPKRAAKKMASGVKATLRYEGITWAVECGRKLLCEGDVARGIGVELNILEELTKPSLPKSNWWAGRSSQIHAVNRDPVLPVAMLVAFMIAILIMPRSGQQWGILEALTKNAQGSLRSVSSSSR